MAIERFVLADVAELKAMIDGLNYFAASDTDGSENIIWYMDEEMEKPVLKINSSGLSWWFSHDGNMGDSNHYIYNTTGAFPNNVYRTKNGLLFSSETQYYSSYWNQYALLLGKTNNDAVAVALQYQYNTPYRVSIAAYGDATKGITDFALRYSTHGYSECPQIVDAPLPTCPASGVSYIKGARGLIVAPWDYYWGEAEIGGVRYATNGYLALSDE